MNDSSADTAQEKLLLQSAPGTKRFRSDDVSELLPHSMPSKRSCDESEATSLTDVAENILLARDHALPANNAIQAKLVFR